MITFFNVLVIVLFLFKCLDKLIMPILSLSVMSDSLRPHGLWLASLLCPWNFSDEKYCSTLPFPPPEDLPDPGIKPVSLASPVLAGRLFTTDHLHVCVLAKLLQACLTLCSPVDCYLPGFSVHGIFQERIQEWVAKLSSRGSSGKPQINHRWLLNCIKWWEENYKEV